MEKVEEKEDRVEGEISHRSSGNENKEVLINQTRSTWSKETNPGADKTGREVMAFSLCLD